MLFLATYRESLSFPSPISLLNKSFTFLILNLDKEAIDITVIWQSDLIIRAKRQFLIIYPSLL
jgi:hypothetical protein